MIEKKLNQMDEQSKETVNNGNTINKELSETLEFPKCPEVILSQPGEDSPKIKTYKVNNSYFANKGCSRSEGSRTYSIQDLVTIETGHYCSPDGRDYSNYISKINLFPKEEDTPEEYDNTTSDKYGSGQYDYLAYDKENKEIFSYIECNQLSSRTHYFRVSTDDTVIFPGIETVQECNGGYLHHIIIDNKSAYKDVKEDSIQGTINALYDQKIIREKLEEYRKKYGDIGLELPWTKYSSGYYQPRVYMGDQHGTPAHEYSSESWNANSLLVKFGKPGDYINFYRGREWYTISIDEDKRVYISNHTSCRWNNNQKRWYDELYESNIQRGQIFINGEDVYESTMSRISEKQKETKENRENKFTELKDKLVRKCSFTESEFCDMCKYAGKGNVLSFLSKVISMMDTSDITKDEILNVMKDIKYPGNDMVFWNYVLIKRKSKTLKHKYVKKVVDKGYAWSYLYDTMPGIGFVGYFDDAMAALKLGLESGIFRKGNIVYSTEKPDSNVSDLGQKLLDAGVPSEINS